MKKTVTNNWSIIFILVIFVFIAGCGNAEDKKKTTPAPAAESQQIQPAAAATSNPPAEVAKQPEAQTDSKDIAVSVDGSILKKSDVEKSSKEKLSKYKDQIPADKIKEARASIKKQLIEEFIIFTLMSNEADKRKVEATEKEMKVTLDQIKASLPPNKKLDAFMKENGISRDYIALGIKVKKMVQQDLGKKAKPTQKEISKFYDDNKDQFTVPESVHVRHILITINKEDDDKVKAEKKSKIEGLRKQIVEGADFAEIAKKNSDCPSKENGGDLGSIKRGQTVKPFEDAAFTQEIKAIGPVITTEYGYHLIQVLEKNAPKTVALDEVKEKIAAYLEQQKHSEAFNVLLKQLRAKAKIVMNDK